MPRKSLAEIMGSSASQAVQQRPLSFGDLPDLLGDGMPKLEFTPLGRIRLVKALRNRFGAGFRNVPGISDLLNDFDSETGLAQKIREIKLAKGGR